MARADERGKWSRDYVLQLKRWSVETLSEVLERRISMDELGIPLEALGMDSLALTIMASGLEEEFGIVVDPYWLIEHPNLDSFFDQLPNYFHASEASSASESRAEV